MTPLERYQYDLSENGFIPDPVQAQAVEMTHALYHRLINQNLHKKTFLKKLFGRAIEPTKGLYFWGGTGRGKTYLLDSFYESLPFAEKRRVHFHHFMQDVHHRLKQLPKTPDPLPIVARQLAADTRLICLDEFHVNDITDAMLLGGLLEAIFAHGVTLVTSSNIAPDDLYKNGLQRERFMPAIALIKRHTDVFHLDNHTDYRLALLEKSGTYHSPLNERSAQLMCQHFEDLNNESEHIIRPIKVNGREIDTLGWCSDIVWFDFKAICETPRSAADYLDIASNYHTVLLSNIPQLGEEQDDAAKRFIHLIDALYDHQVKLVVSAESEPEQLYLGERMSFPFQRTISRLAQMRSHDYLALPHKP